MDRTALKVGTENRQFAISWGVLITVFIQVISWASVWGSTTNKIDTQTQRIQVLEQIHAIDQRSITDLLQLTARLNQKLDDLSADYERDANRYIREPHDRH